MYNIFHQELEDELFPLALKNNVGIIARVPLERGLLTGKFTNYATDIVGDAVRGDRFTPEEFQKVSAAVEKLRFLVKGDVQNLGEAALRFVLSHPAVSMAIPGMQKVARVEENVKASNGPLPPEDLARLRQLYQTEFRPMDFH